MRGGWFHTGDAAVVHPDGYVEIRDRLKDVIISGGENISSVEVEGVLLRHPAVQEVAVVGLPDEKWGEAPHAFVVLQAGRHARPTEELRAFARERLAHFKAPHSVHTSSPSCRRPRPGKIQKYVLRGGQAGHRPAVAAISNAGSNAGAHGPGPSSLQQGRHIEGIDEAKLERVHGPGRRRPRRGAQRRRWW